ncbi:alpha/beta fold hydrolase [Crossiella cryophila]|uniref:Pimeloyl-ACP methyl ester carboxylesterase n=1 Tax=Crossiella cryophila TaxID=43355 RepID=A0A7W7FSI4_9PSEU|nr:alpha/beta hydrolase [Crossiella cryophila]MBB4676207.1 pimeloyl-ACP methyl ester carboxylesterase [Crossiella cryophila]
MGDNVMELVVESGPVPLAVRDHGGDGPPLLLLHGLGGSMAHWDPLLPELTATHRVVLMDLRGHDGSGVGPWSWAAALADVEAVITALDLGDPAVVGMSLGGMVATRWAGRPGCPGAVNLDGLRGFLTAPENYPGLDPALRDKEIERLRVLFDGHAAAVTGPLAQIIAEARAALEEDHIGACLAAQSPLLVVVATENLPAQQQFPELAEAFRRGLERDLAALDDVWHVQVERIGSSHAMVTQHPAEVAKLIRRFLAG